jgi:hypothetical protein
MHYDDSRDPDERNTASDSSGANDRKVPIVLRHQNIRSSRPLLSLQIPPPGPPRDLSFSIMRTLCALLATIVANKSFPKQCQSLTHCSETIEPRSSAQKIFSFIHRCPFSFFISFTDNDTCVFPDPPGQSPQDFLGGRPKTQTPPIDRHFGKQRNNGATMALSWMVPGRLLVIVKDQCHQGFVFAKQAIKGELVRLRRPLLAQ